MSPEKQLETFISKYSPEIAARAQLVLKKMRKLYPTAMELVYDNYNALAIGFGPSERASEAIFSIALYPRWVSLFFLQAKGLPDPEGLLKGSGKVAKHVVLTTPAMLDESAVRILMDNATARAKVQFAADGQHRLMIKSVSDNQRPRRATRADAAPLGGSRAARKG